jgi:hypothetical protein
MQRLRIVSGLLMIVILTSLSACGRGAAGSPTVDAAPIYTQMASTALALQTQTALAAPTATNTPQASPTLNATNAPQLTDTPQPGTPSATPLASHTPKVTSQAGCDNFDPNILDVTIPDNTEIAPGDSFIKTWRFKNLGPCTWDQDYKLIFSYDNVSGDTKWNEVRPVFFPNLVKPGETMEISVTLTAPKKPGTYRGVFRLQNNNNFNFGIEFWVQIIVK